MKNIILILFLSLSTFAFSQDVTVVHFNYEWNSRNGFKKLDNLKSAKSYFDKVFVRGFKILTDPKVDMRSKKFALHVVKSLVLTIPYSLLFVLGKVQYAYVESQSKSLRESIKSVPTIIIYKGDKPVARFEAGLSMKIEIPLDKLQEIVNRHKD